MDPGRMHQQRAGKVFVERLAMCVLFFCLHVFLIRMITLMTIKNNNVCKTEKGA